jgi:hypothetical protein
MYSCTEPEKRAIPVNVLQPDKMASVMAELTLAEAAINMHSFTSGAGKTDSLKFNVYRTQGISRGAYDSSLVFYSADPEEFKLIYDKVVEKLSRMQTP